MKNYHSGLGNPEDQLSEHQEWLQRKEDRELVKIVQRDGKSYLMVHLGSLPDPIGLCEKISRMETLKERLHAIADAL